MVKICLLEIPSEGRDYFYSKTSGELNAELQDLIGKENYEIALRIEPLQQSTYLIKGTIKTQTQLDCSRCGEGFAFAIEKSLKEFVLPKSARSEAHEGHFARNLNHEGEDAEVTHTEYEGQNLNLGEFLHEVIALELPVYPSPKIDCLGHCVVCKKDVQSTSFGYDEAIEQSPRQSPFAALKDFIK